MMDEDELLAVAGICLIKKLKVAKKTRRPQKCWIEKRATLSHINLIKELTNEPDDFRNYLRMDETTYRHLLDLVTPLIKRYDTVMKCSITPHERLSATLRFLATGRTYEDLKFSTCISKSALSNMIPETCDAIYRVLKQEYLKFPKTTADWKKIALDFQNRWNFPHCLGAVDGKHVQITAPPGSGSYYFNYKKTFSVVLMGIANANYEFIYCDVGTNGRVSDGGVIENTTFMKNLIANKLNIPEPEIVVSDEPPLHYVFVGDEAFAMRHDFLKPYNQREHDYEKRIFNYRLSRARRIIENSFGILANRFRIFHTRINLKVDNIDTVILACCALHNFLRRNSSNSYTPSDVFDFEDTSTGLVTPGLRTDSENL
ncbi:hypothetical protein RI129_003025 [Pyrocoelia pectoralis]|uniref:DDE Tnp4 domain-containing protein n=1 Tax=Pyrocoelia pectoralis TaxID=417401 RepID=A0AAN7VQ84_9COLE